jgi:competence protein ComEA
VERYTRRQLVLLLVVVLVAGAGIGIDRWRRSHAELADRLEAFDRAPAPLASSGTPQPDAAPRPAAPARAPARPTRAPATARHPAPAADPTTPLDLNGASVDDLDRLPGIGHGLAARIVESRVRNGPFGAVDELRRVRGIGRVTLDRLRPLLVITRPP